MSGLLFFFNVLGMEKGIAEKTSLQGVKSGKIFCFGDFREGESQERGLESI